MSTVEYEIILNNGQLKQAATESVSKIKDMGSAAKRASGEMADGFKNIGEQIAFQKDIIKGLEEQIKELERALKTAAPGSAYSEVVNELNSVKSELAGEKKGLAELEMQAKSTEQKHVSLRAELRQVREELVAMEAAGERGTEAYRALQERAGALQDAMSDANAQMRIMANDQRGAQGVISGLQGISGAMSAVSGAYGLFAGENENLQRIMLKVQSLMAITIGLQQVQQTLNKDSAFQLVVVANAKKAWAKATQFLNVQLGISNALSKALVASGIGAIIAAVGLAISAITKLTKKTKEANEEAQRAAEEQAQSVRDFNKSVGSGAAQSVYTIEKLSLKWKQLGDSIRDKKKFIVDNSKEFEKLGVNIRNVADAEELLIKNKSRYIDAMIAKAKASAFADKYKEQYKNIIDEAEGHAKGLDIIRRTQDAQDDLKSSANGNPLTAAQKAAREKQRQNEYLKDYNDYLREKEKSLRRFLDEEIRLETEADGILNSLNKGGKSAGTGSAKRDNSEQELLGFKANKEKLLAEYRSAKAEIESKLGVKVKIEGVEHVYTQSDIDQEIAVLEGKYYDDLDALREKYRKNMKPEVSEEDVKEAASRYEELLSKYADYKQKVADVNAKYDADKASAGNDAGLQSRIDAERSKELAALMDEAMKSSGVFKLMESDVTSLGKSIKNVLINRLSELVSFLKLHKGDASVATSENANLLGIDVDVLRDLLNSSGAIERLERQLDSLGNNDAISKVVDSIKKLKQATREYKEDGSLINEENLARAKDTLDSAVKSLEEAMASSLQRFSEALREIGELTGNEQLVEGSEFMSDMLSNFQAAQEGAEAWGGWWGAIIGGVTDLIPKLVKWCGTQRQLNKVLEETGKEVAIIDSKMRELSAGGLTMSKYYDMMDLYRDKLAQLNEALAALERHNKKGKNDEAIAAMQAEIAETEAAMQELTDSMYETLGGISASDVFDTLSDAIWEAFTTGKDALEDFEGSFNDMMANVVKKNVLWRLFGDSVDSFVADLTTDIFNGDLANNDYIEQYRQQWNDMMSEGVEVLNSLNDVFEGLGVFGSDSSLTGSIQSITSEQAGMLAGQMNAIRMSQSEHTSILTDSLVALNGIEQNTRYIKRIYYKIQNGTGIDVNRAYGSNNI